GRLPHRVQRWDRPFAGGRIYGPARHAAIARRIRHTADRSGLGRGSDCFARCCGHRGWPLSGAPGRALASRRGAAPGVANPMLLELGRQAYNALKHNRRRSILTMLGMAWGIATVVLLLAYGSGFERGLWVAFRSWGTNLVFIFPGRTSLQAGGTKA